MSALAVAAGLALAAPAAGQVANTWSGTWVNSAPDGSFWVFSQSGQSVGGVWKGSASSGTLSGTVQGSALSGTFVNNEAGQSANFSITLAPDGHSFSGTFTIVGGSTGQWRSACSGGACLSNAAPPPPPPPPPPGGPPGGGPPPAQTSPKLLAAATAWGQVGPATALEPGGQAIATSPPISARQRGVSVTLSGDVSGETAVVLGVPTHYSGPGRPIRRGDCVRAAVGGAQATKEVVEGKGLNPKGLTEDDVILNFVSFMISCLDYVKQLEKEAHPAALTPAAGAARLSCRLRARALSVRVDRAAGKFSYRTRGGPRRQPGRRLRASCQRAKDGKLTVRIRTRSRRAKLRKVLGPRLVVGFHRITAGSGTVNVQAAFKRR